MWNNAVYVCDSKIEGKGLTAKRDIYKNEVIVDYRYLDCWFEVAVTDLTDYQISHNWIIMIDENTCRTTNTVKEITYMNHSRTPNTNWFVKEKYITALRDIKQGEEITIDYRIEERSNRVSFPEWI
jgi:hypothetical protein